MFKSCSVYIVLGLLFSTTLYSLDHSSVAGAENGGMDNCFLCKDVSHDAYGNPITTQTISRFIDKKETFPNSNNFVCISCDCGNGKLDEFEQCDDGNNVGFDGCTAHCVKELCGDGVIQPINFDGIAEKCDDGAQNANIKDRCRTNCQLPRCGDGVQDSREECDLGQGNSHGFAGCDTYCRSVICGDGEVTGAEQCDDANQSNSDLCSNSCIPTRCGDGIVQAARGEVCDDGNGQDIGDTCRNNCTNGVDSCARSYGEAYYGYGDCCAEIPQPWAEHNAYDENGVLRGAVVCLRGNYDFATDVTVDVGGGTHVGLGQNDENSRTFLWYAVERTRLALGSGATDWGVNTANYENGVWQSKIAKNYDRYGRACWTCAYARLTGCFVPETLITMGNGSQKKIDEIKSGEEVLNPITGKGQKVKSILESNESEPIIEISAGGKTLKVTQKHPMYTGKDFIKASDVKVGTILMLSKNESVVVTAVKQLPVDPNQRVLNITLESDSESKEEHVVIADGLVTGDLLVQKQLK